MTHVETSAPSGLWESIVSSVERRIGPRACRTWICPARIQGLDAGVLKLGVPNHFFVDWLSEHYIRLLNEAASDALGRPVKVEIHADERARQNGNGDSRTVNSGSAGDGEVNGDGTAIESHGPDVAAQSYTPIERTHTAASCLNPSNTFNSLVVSDSNRLAAAACMAVAERPGATYNPLFLYGSSGLGKTHMLHAIGHAASAGASNEVCYVSAERFMNEMIASIQQGTALAFRNRYRRARLLLIDDVHFLGGKESTQEEFFHTFNSLHESGRQIVLTSDRPPKEIARLEERLISRFTWGLVADIQKPDLETRVAILNQKAARQGFNLCGDVALAIAQMASGNVRELEGSLVRVRAHAQLTRRPLTPDIVTEVLGDILRPRVKAATVLDVQQLVARHFSLRPQDLCGRKRTNAIAFPRQVAMYLCRSHLDTPLAEIGERFGGRDHTTVLHACSKIESQLKTDTRLRKIVADLACRLPASGDRMLIN